MKKSLMLVALIFMSNAILGYSYTIKNNLSNDHTIKYRIEYAGCTDDTGYIKAGKKRTVSSGGCCISQLNVRDDYTGSFSDPIKYTVGRCTSRVYDVTTVDKDLFQIEELE